VEATRFTQRAVAEAKEVNIHIKSWDKYGGRVLGMVVLDGRGLSEMLIEAGLARPYKGEAKSSWCE
jgi:endonuclease YncB( thermonuclease family)